MEEGAVGKEQIVMATKAAWLAAFSVVIFALAIAAAIVLVLFRRRKYMTAVENKHTVNNDGDGKNKIYVTHHMINAFQILLIGFFIAAVVMFVPYCYYSDGSFGNGNWGKAFMAAFHGTLRTFVLDGEYDIIAGFSSELVAVNARVGWFYIVWSWVIYVFAPVFATGIILTLFKSALSYLRYRFRLCVKQIYIMSELNEKSLALAEDIVLSDRRSRGFLRRLFFGSVIVFADVFEKNEEENYELVAQARSLGAICVKRDITEISLRKAKTLFGKRRNRKVYLISENEEENVDHGLKIIERIKSSKYNNRDTEIYIFSCGAESATLIDAAVADNCDMKVRRVDDNHNLILKFLWDNSVFDCASSVDPETNERTFHAVIVGLGGYGMDILRMLCWFVQMPGFRLEVDVFDGENGSEKFKHIAPELYKKNRDVTDGEPHYSITFHDNVMYGSSRFDEEVSALSGVSTVFCTLGDDEENIACSMDMRMLFGRTGEYSRTTPKIYTVVYKPQLSRKLTTRNKKVEYGINFLGVIYERFTDSVIEQNYIEAYGRLINLEYTVNGTVWDLIAANTDFTQPVFKSFAEKICAVDGAILSLFKAHDDGLSVAELDAKVDKIQADCIKIIEDIKGYVSDDIVRNINGNIASTYSYDKFEYNRRSSITCALHVRWLVALYCADSGNAPYNTKIRRVLGVDDYSEIDALLAKNEHCRWSAYTRSIGYVLGKRDDIFKTHNTLMPFDSLPEGNKFIDRPIGALSRYIPIGTAQTSCVSEDK